MFGLKSSVLLPHVMGILTGKIKMQTQKSKPSNGMALSLKELVLLYQHKDDFDSIAISWFWDRVNLLPRGLC